MGACNLVVGHVKFQASEKGLLKRHCWAHQYFKSELIHLVLQDRWCIASVLRAFGSAEIEPSVRSRIIQ